MNTYFEQYSEFLRSTKRASENTQIAYLRDLKHFTQYLDTLGLANIALVSETTIISYLYALQKEGKTAATISRNVATLKGYFRFLFSKGVVLTNPAEGISPPKIEKKSPQSLSVESINLLLKQPSGSSNKAVRDKAMLEVLYATGIRTSELVHLKLSDVDLHLNIIKCTDRIKERFIPIGSKASKELKYYINNVRDKMLKGKNSDLLFVNCNGTSMSRQGFWKIIKFYAKKANITENITPHILRHSFAAHMVQNGADLHVVQELMGHADISTTQIYIQPHKKMLLDEYAKAHPRY